jgi:hypothetical protein
VKCKLLVNVQEEIMIRYMCMCLFYFTFEMLNNFA